MQIDIHLCELNYAPTDEVGVGSIHVCPDCDRRWLAREGTTWDGRLCLEWLNVTVRGE